MDKSDVTFVEPMDVDTSSNSVSKMDISCNDSNDKILINLKTEKEDFYDADTSFNSSGNNKKLSKSPRLKTNYHADTSLNSGTKNFSLNRTTIHNEADTSHSSTIKEYINSPRIERYHIKIERKSRNYNHRSKYIKICFFALVAVFVSLLAHFYFNIKCNDDNNITDIEEMLSSNLFGQENAVNAITNALSKNISSKIIFMYGTTGVGKTYATSIIVEKFKQAINFYHYTMPNFVNTFSTEVMFGMAFCKTTVIVIDDLKPKDIMGVKSVVSSLIDKSKGLSKNITVILIFNCEDISGTFDKKCGETFLHQLKESFSDVKADKTFVKFKKLNNRHLKQCIEKELNGKRISIQEMSDILKNFDVSLDGCKGVHTRVKFLHPT